MQRKQQDAEKAAGCIENNRAVPLISLAQLAKGKKSRP
jgi:hypothetical protein